MLNANRFIIFTLCCLGLNACQLNQYVPEVNNGMVDLRQTGKGEWTKICVFAPYSDDQDAKRILGFEWDLEQQTTIDTDDSVSLLVYVRGQYVVGNAQLKRTQYDFAHLHGQCFKRADTLFKLVDGKIISASQSL